VNDFPFAPLPAGQRVTKTRRFLRLVNSYQTINKKLKEIIECLRCVKYAAKDLL
jgi:hypothetical protein